MKIQKKARECIIKNKAFEIAKRETFRKPKMIIWLLASLIFDSIELLENEIIYR